MSQLDIGLDVLLVSATRAVRSATAGELEHALASIAASRFGASSRAVPALEQSRAILMAEIERRTAAYQAGPVNLEAYACAREPR